MDSTGFHKRGFTSFMTFGGFVIMTLTGLVLYLAPQGRVAYWVEWHMMGLSKTDWGNVHVISSLVFAGFGIYHLVLNWKPFTSYIAGKGRAALRLKTELITALVLCVIVFGGSVVRMPGFSQVLDFGEYLKESWVKDKTYEPPFGHAELLSLKTFAARMNMDADAALDALAKAGIKTASIEEKLIDIAGANNLTPRDVYEAIRHLEPKAEAPASITPDEVETRFAGTGIGRKQLSWMLEEIGVPADTAAKRLEAVGIKISPDETLKSAGESNGMDPIEILKVIMIEGYTPGSAQSTHKSPDGLK